jgi:hypothetical protein
MSCAQIQDQPQRIRSSERAPAVAVELHYRQVLGALLQVRARFGSGKWSIISAVEAAG